jgi:phage-related protein
MGRNESVRGNEGEFGGGLLTFDNKCVIMWLIEGRIVMYEVVFYRDGDGRSEIVEYLDSLNAAGKNDRINRNKILAYIGALAQYGTRVGMPVVRHIDGNLWELRPLANRLFFFYWKDNKFVLLHHYIKKSQKAPAREIERARAKMKDYIERFGE